MEVAAGTPSVAGWLRIADSATWIDESALEGLSAALTHWPDALRTVRGKWVSGRVHPCLRLGRSLVVKSLNLDPAVIERIAASPYARSLAHVDLSNLSMRPNTGYYLAKIASSPYLSRVRSLKLRDDPLDEDSLTGFVESGGLAQLEELDLSGTELGPGAARLLAAARLPRLRALSLSSNSLGDDGAIALFDAAFAPNLQSLDLYGNMLTSVATAALVQSGRFRGLRRLDVGCSELGVDAAAALVAGGLPELRELGLSMMLLDAPLESFFEAIRVPLTHVDLSDAGLQVEHLRVLASSDRLGSLESLFLSANGLDEDGLEILVASPLLRRVHTLGLKHNGLGPRGLEMLLRAPREVPLRRLELDGNPIGDDGLRMLADWPAATHLERLAVRAVGASADGRRVLLVSPHLPADVRSALEVQAG